MADCPRCGASPVAERQAFLAARRALGPRRMDELFAVGYDDHWGDVSAVHAAFVRDLIGLTAPGAVILDAACGTGKYVPEVLRSGRRVVGIDRSQGMLVQLKRKFPDVGVRQLALEDLAGEPGLAGQYDGLLCVDAMENVPPEDWPVILAGFAHVLGQGSPLYLTVEIPEPEDEPEDEATAGSPEPPLVAGEVLWPDDHGGGYHYYPGRERAADWLTAAGFGIIGTGEGAGYVHVLAAAS